VDTPTILKVNWLRAVPHLLAIALAGYIINTISIFQDWSSSLLAGWIIIIIYRLIIRYTVTKDHARGMKLVKTQRFQEAVEAFQKSRAFFEKHPTLDKWRSIIFLSPGKYGYKEMALANLGFVYGQLGEGKKSIEFYEECLKLNPGNGVAKAALNLINAK